MPSQYTNCYTPTKAVVQINVELDVIMSVFSTGPVSIGDGNGLTNVSRVMRTCMQDGRLLAPTRPMMPVDRTLWAAPGVQVDKANPTVYTASTTLVAGASWHFMLVVDVPSGFVLNLTSDLYPAPAAGTLFAARAWTGSGCTDGQLAHDCGIAKVHMDSNLTLRSPGTAGDDGKHSWAMYMLAPVTSGWAFLGELDKYVAVSAARVRSPPAAQPHQLTVELLGPAGLNQTFYALAPQGQVRAKTATFAADGTATVTFTDH